MTCCLVLPLPDSTFCWFIKPLSFDDKVFFIILLWGVFITCRSLLMLIHAFSGEQRLWIFLLIFMLVQKLFSSEQHSCLSLLTWFSRGFGVVPPCPFLSELFCHSLDGCWLRYESQKWKSVSAFFSAFKQITLNRTIMHYVPYCSIG